MTNAVIDPPRQRINKLRLEIRNSTVEPVSETRRMYRRHNEVIKTAGDTESIIRFLTAYLDHSAISTFSSLDKEEYAPKQRAAQTLGSIPTLERIYFLVDENNH